MAALSIRELNSNISKVIDRVEAGEVIDISRHGKIVAEIRRKRPVRDEAWHKARRESEAFLRKGLPLSVGKITEEDRYGDADL